MPQLPCLWECFDTIEWENTKKELVGCKSTLLKGREFGPKNTKDSQNL